MPGIRSLEVARSYVRAFLDLHRLGRPQPLLQRPDARCAEVEFCG